MKQLKSNEAIPSVYWIRFVLIVIAITAVLLLCFSCSPPRIATFRTSPDVRYFMQAYILEYREYESTCLNRQIYEQYYYVPGKDSMVHSEHIASYDSIPTDFKGAYPAFTWPMLKDSASIEGFIRHLESVYICGRE